MEKDIKKINMYSQNTCKINVSLSININKLTVIDLYNFIDAVLIFYPLENVAYFHNK